MVAIQGASGFIAKRVLGQIRTRGSGLAITATDHAGGGGGGYVWERKHTGEDAPFKVDFELALQDASLQDLTTNAKRILVDEIARFLGRWVISPVPYTNASSPRPTCLPTPPSPPLQAKARRRCKLLT